MVLLTGLHISIKTKFPFVLWYFWHFCHYIHCKMCALRFSLLLDIISFLWHRVKKGGALWALCTAPAVPIVRSSTDLYYYAVILMLQWFFHIIKNKTGKFSEHEMLQFYSMSSMWKTEKKNEEILQHATTLKYWYLPPVYWYHTALLEKIWWRVVSISSPTAKRKCELA